MDLLSLLMRGLRRARQGLQWAWQRVLRQAEPPAPARFEELPFDAPRGQRHYKLFTPAGLAPNEPAPLVVMLHGCRQTPDDFAAGTRMNQLAQQQRFRVLYPAQTAQANPYRCWNWFRPGDQRRGAGEPALLAGMVQAVMRTHAVDAARVYVAGLSAGGAMAAILAREYPELFAAAGVHSGLAHGAANGLMSAVSVMKRGPPERLFGWPVNAVSAVRAALAADVPLIVFHGDQDATVHPRNGDRLVAGHTRSAVLPGELEGGRSFVRTLYGDAQGQTVAEHWLVHGSGHAWSGGSEEGSFTDAQGPDASREMLRFFFAQPPRSA